MHCVQVKSEFPDSLASKRLDDWSEMLFEMQAVPKVRQCSVDTTSLLLDIMCPINMVSVE